jgi:indole-3-glycerol phosphate synthase
MSDTLKEIIAKKKERIGSAKQSLTQEELKTRLAGLPATRPFIDAIIKPKNISLIAEIKKQSPSGGIICEDFNPVEIAKIYQQAGAQAISVLTEEDFFGGALSYINEVKQAVSLPVLRKDFILEPYQVYESRIFGADAILLIADVLTKEELNDMIALADSLSMDCLVEVHTLKELRKVLNMKVVPLADLQQTSAPKQGSKVKAKNEIDFLIGINNRDLHTLEVDFRTTELLYPLVPKDRLVVVESGIKSYQDILFLKILGVNAVLVGEAILKAEDKRSKIQDLMGW